MVLFSSWFQFTSWIPFLLLSATSAQTIQQILWNVPDGKLADLSQTFAAGQTLPLSWNAYSSTQYVDTTKNLVDLWVTAFDFNLNPFTQRITTSIDLGSPGNFAWTISITDGNLTISAKYVLRFKITSPVFNESNGDLSSPGFLVLRAAATSSTALSSPTSAVSSPSSTISITSAIISTTPNALLTSTTTVGATSTSSVTAESPSSGLSNGAKGGIGAGVGVLALALGGLAYFFWLMRRGKGTKSNVESGETLEENKNVTSPAEMPVKTFVVELPVNNH